MSEDSSERLLHLKVFTALYVVRATQDPRPISILSYVFDTFAMFVINVLLILISGRPHGAAVEYMELDEVAARAS